MGTKDADSAQDADAQMNIAGNNAQTLLQNKRPKDALAPAFAEASECSKLRESADVLLPGVVDPSVPTLLARWDRVWSTHIKLAHYDGGIFNVTILDSVVRHPCCLIFLRIVAVTTRSCYPNSSNHSTVPSAPSASRRSHRLSFAFSVLGAASSARRPFATFFATHSLSSAAFSALFPLPTFSTRLVLPLDRTSGFVAHTFCT